MSRQFTRAAAALFALAFGFSGASMMSTRSVRAMCTCMIRRQPPPQFRTGGVETQLLSDASMVVLMREGTRTVVSMRNDYRGPAEEFAMVVPVPEILREGQVRTLDHDIFQRIERFSAPRLVEFWEQNPCGGTGGRARSMPSAAPRAAGEATADTVGGTMRPLPPPVVVEAEYGVAEYDIVILSAEDSNGLETWLRDHGYNLPAGASEVFRPYIAQGTKFFVAKVDPSRARIVDGRARLSPLQFHYDSEQLVLPIRLGLLNSPGMQDLVVHTLTRFQRMEVANHPNVVMPTNLRVAASVRDDFAAFYAGLYDQVVGSRTGAVVTEFAGDLRDADLRRDDLLALGADIIATGDPRGLTLTRLRYRYDHDTIGDDLVFRGAPAIGGGDEQIAEDGSLGAHDARPRTVNAFRARFAVLHPWTGAVVCAAPRGGRWGHPPHERPRAPAIASERTSPLDAGRIDAAIEGGLAAIGVSRSAAATAVVTEGKVPTLPVISPPAPPPAATRRDDDGGFCASSSTPPRGVGGWLALGAVALVLSRRGRRRDPGQRARGRSQPPDATRRDVRRT